MKQLERSLEWLQEKASKYREAKREYCEHDWRDGTHHLATLYKQARQKELEGDWLCCNNCGLIRPKISILAKGAATEKDA